MSSTQRLKQTSVARHADHGRVLKMTDGVVLSCEKIRTRDKFLTA